MKLLTRFVRKSEVFFKKKRKEKKKNMAFQIQTVLQFLCKLISVLGKSFKCPVLSVWYISRRVVFRSEVLITLCKSDQYLVITDKSARKYNYYATDVTKERQKVQ